MSSMHTGEKIIIGGLFVQLVSFALFVVVAGVFHHRLVNDKPVRKQFHPSAFFRREHKSLASTTSMALTRNTVPPRANLNELPWKRHLYNLYFTSGLLVVRSLFRIIEYIQGNSGYLLSHEVFLYIFDAVLMLAVMVMFNWIYPSEVTEAYGKKPDGTMTTELHQVRDGYMRRDAQLGKEEVRNTNNKGFRGGWIPSR